MKGQLVLSDDTHPLCFELQDGDLNSPCVNQIEIILYLLQVFKWFIVFCVICVYTAVYTNNCLWVQ